MGKTSVIFVLGPPGAGKGTQCAKLSQKFGYPHLSAGELLRSEVANHGPDGDLIQSLISKGNIVPSSITVGLLSRAMKSNPEKNFLVDGFPRNQENVNTWQKILGEEVDVRCMLFYTCSEKVCVDRVLNRGQGRADDTREIIQRRIQVYNTSTLPVVEHYRNLGMLRIVDAEGPVEEVFAATCSTLAPEI